MKIKPHHRHKLTYYLNEFYKRFPHEKYTIFHFVKWVKQRLKEQNKDLWLAVCGDTSMGKSLFAIMCQILFGRPYDLTKNISYIPEGQEISNKINEMIFQTLLVDEAARDLRAVNWQKKSQQKVTLDAQTERFRNNWIFLNMPNFNEFTKSLKRTSVKFRAIIPYRTDKYARIIIQAKSRNWRSEDAWGDEAANKTYAKLEKSRKEITNDDILKIERSQSNYVLDFIVPNLEIILPEITNTYEELKKESRNKKEELTIDNKTNHFKNKYQELLTKVSKILYYNQLNIGKQKPTLTNISESLGISTQTLRKYIQKKEKDKDTSIIELRKQIKKE